MLMLQHPIDDSHILTYESKFLLLYGHRSEERTKAHILIWLNIGTMRVEGKRRISF